MNREFTHYVLTKFNIVASWYKDCAEQEGGRHTTKMFHTPEWLNERIRLFEAYCLPSVVNQVASFIWLVEFNSQSDRMLLDRIEAWKKRCPFLVPLYVEPYADDAIVVRDYIAQHTSTDYVITTNLDNDDMIHRDFLIKIQKAFKHQDGQIIHYSSGLQYIEDRQILFSWQNFGNHFYSYVEKSSSQPTTCVDIQHGKVNNYLEIGSHTEPGWIEIVHKCNVYNHAFELKPIWYNTKVTFNVHLNIDMVGFLLEYIKLNKRRVASVWNKIKIRYTKR